MLTPLYKFTTIINQHSFYSKGCIHTIYIIINKNKRTNTTGTPLSKSHDFLKYKTGKKE